MMSLRPMTERCAKEVCGWKYGEPYSVYNYPDWETCTAGGWAIADSLRRERELYAVYAREDGRDILCGFLRYMEGNDSVTLGLGLRPDLCGKGLGAELMAIAINEYKRRFPKLALELDVRPFNERAIKCYINSGFVVTGGFTGHTPQGDVEFFHMRYSENGHR